MAGVRKTARIPAIALAAAVAALATCSNPSGYLDAVNDEAKESLDMYLVVSGISPTKDAFINPSSPIKIDFDRSIDTDTIESNIVLTPADPAVATPALSWTYNDDQKRLTISTSLEGDEEYQITVRQGLKSANGEPLQSDYTSSFTTLKLPSGSIVINGVKDSITGIVSNPTYTNSSTVTLYFAVNGQTNSYIATQVHTEVEGEPATIPIVGASWSITRTLDLTGRDGDGDSDDEIAFYARFKKDSTEIYSDIVSDTIIYDITPPDAPSVTGATPTKDTTPTWSWAQNATSPGNGQYRIQLDSGSWTETPEISWTPTTAFTVDGPHTLNVQERDAAGNWSASGQATIEIDWTPPGAPSVEGTSPTSDPTPTWTWTQSASLPGNGQYRYQFNSTSGSWTETTQTSWTSTAALTDDVVYTLYVQERDAADNWSASGSKAITIDLSAPGAPVVVGPALTTDATPTWTWTSGGGGNGTFAYALDSSARPESPATNASPSTTDLSFTPSAALADGAHTLYVWESDSLGNWSAYGYLSTTVDTTPPSAPDVSGTTPTNDKTPTWTWTGGGGGNGTFAFAMDGSTTRPTTSTSTSSASTTDISFTPPEEPPLTDGGHSFYVWERDEAGNWSSYGSKPITIDTSAPSSPTITTTSGTTDRTPSWSWTAGAGGNGTYSYRLYYRVKLSELPPLYLNVDVVPWTTSSAATAYTHSTELVDRIYYFSVMEYDDAGNSAYGTVSLEINAAPNAPLVTSDSVVGVYDRDRYCVDTTPTWTWSSGGFGNGTFAYSLDSSTRPTVVSDTASPSTEDTSFTPGSALSNGSHSLYVWERDASTVEPIWSVSRIYTLNVTPTYPINAATGVSTKPDLYWRPQAAPKLQQQQYTVQYKLPLDIEWRTLENAVNLTTPYFLYPSRADPLPLGTTFEWRVRYTNILGNTAYWPSSSGVSFTTIDK